MKAREKFTSFLLKQKRSVKSSKKAGDGLLKKQVLKLYDMRIEKNIALQYHVQLLTQLN